MKPLIYSNNPRIVLIACCIAILLPGTLIFGLPGVLSPFWQEAFQVGKADIGQILFFILAGVGLFMFASGRLQAAYGPAAVMACGAIIYGLATMLLGNAVRLEGVFAWAFAVGIASALIYLPAITVAQLWYPRQRGLASGLVSMFFGLSGAIMAPVYRCLLEWYGYGPMTKMVGCGAMVLGILASSRVRYPETASPDPHPNPELTFREMFLQTVRTRSFWLLWLVFAFVGAAGIAMVPLSTLFGTARQLSLSDAVIILSCFNVTNGVSRLISGFLSDITGRKLIMGISFLLAGFAYFLLPLVSGLWLWSLMAAVIGYAFGTLFAVTAPLVGDCFGMIHFGSIFGLVFTAFGFLSGALGPWLGGYLLDISGGNFSLVFSYLGSLMLVSALMIWFLAPHTECRF
jgi:OFA family oxalate/formate antiporter-like MFS transporter